MHRDLKPANVILTRREDGADQVKLVDFGIAKLLPQAGKVQQQLTRTGEVFGSPIYMSPEQCLGRELDTRSDIYALGCLMYEAVAGEPPFIGDSYLATMNMHVEQHPKLISEKAPGADVPSELEAAILCCLQKDPDIRFQTLSFDEPGQRSGKDIPGKRPKQIVLRFQAGVVRQTRFHPVTHVFFLLFSQED